ncbi:MAG: type pilus assembly protein PilC [Frankiaceae bacterium]|jgi:type IV pilus assembly protein PilC|nr:type pilus assembly protein PilC [Frankiaceae bacterium]
MSIVTDETSTPAEVPDVDVQPSRLRALMQFQVTTKKVKPKDLMQFSRQMAVFIKAGIPILTSLDSITEEMSNKHFREILLTVRRDLEGGATFTDAMARHGEVFPQYYLGILRSAELTGSLDVALVQLSDYIERDVEARRKVVSALTYPAIVALMSVGVVLVLVLFVLPRFEKFFKGLGAKLPLPTRMLLSFAHFVSNDWWVFAGIFVLLLAAVLWTTRSVAGRRARDRVILRLPIVGDLVQHSILERFCRILSSMISAGVPLPTAMTVSGQAASNSVYRSAIESTREAMLRGEGLAGPLANTGLFPAAARQMFRVGEDTGTLDEQLNIAAEYYERELDYKIKRFTGLFEPTVIVMMGLVVGFVAVALVSAMYGIFRSSAI